MKEDRTMYRLLLALMFSLSATLAASPAHATPAAYGHVAGEFMTIHDMTAALPTLADKDLTLVIDWPASAVPPPERYAFVSTANAAGVTVFPWLLLPPEQGYWPSSTNAEAFDLLARYFVATWELHGLAPSTLVIDMEMPLQRAQQFVALAKAKDAPGMQAFLRAGINRPQFAAATVVFANLVTWLQSKGWKVELSCQTQVLDDILDGDDDLIQAFNTPIYGINWDVMTFQLYRTLNTWLLGPGVPATTSYFVYGYGDIAKDNFGAKASVFIGLTNGGIEPTATLYTNGSQMLEDINAARKRGFTREQIGVYNLKGIMNRPPLSQWFLTPPAWTPAPWPDVGTSLTRVVNLQLDSDM